MARGLHTPGTMYSSDVFRINAPRVAEELGDFIRENVFGALRKRGAVVALSGDAGSSVVAALSARALGPTRTLGVVLSDRDTPPDSLGLARLVAKTFGIGCRMQDIEPILEAAGCRRDARATNLEKRARKTMEHHHADRLRYALLGTESRAEAGAELAVLSGNGAADLMPIAHLYSAEIHALARHLGVPEEITRRPAPNPERDLFFWGYDQGVDAEQLASLCGIGTEQIVQAYADIEHQRRLARRVAGAPLMVMREARFAPSPLSGTTVWCA